jgi:hypothetical protein
VRSLFDRGRPQESQKRFGIEFYGLEGDGDTRVRDYVARRIANDEVFRL